MTESKFKEILKDINSVLKELEEMDSYIDDCVKNGVSPLDLEHELSLLGPKGIQEAKSLGSIDGDAPVL